MVLLLISGRGTNVNLEHNNGFKIYGRVKKKCIICLYHKKDKQTVTTRTEEWRKAQELLPSNIAVVTHYATTYVTI